MRKKSENRKKSYQINSKFFLLFTLPMYGDIIIGVSGKILDKL